MPMHEGDPTNQTYLARPWDSQGMSIYSTRFVPGVKYSNFANEMIWWDREGCWG